MKDANRPDRGAVTGNKTTPNDGVSWEERGGAAVYCCLPIFGRAVSALTQLYLACWFPVNHAGRCREAHKLELQPQPAAGVRGAATASGPERR